jgi:hypothetical protein
MFSKFNSSKTDKEDKDYFLHLSDDVVFFDAATKQRILVSCLTALCIGNMMMLNVSVFLPTYIDRRNTTNGWDSDQGHQLDAEDVSQIIAIFAIA